MLRFTHVEDASAYEHEIRELVNEQEASFNPPLSARHGTTDTDLRDSVEKDLDTYIDDVMTEPTILAYNGETGDLAGLLSYHRDYTNDSIAAYQPSHHITVVIVDDDHPEVDVYNKLVLALVDTYEDDDSVAFLTARIPDNDAERHDALEDTLGFECVHRARNARPDGSDTLWFARNVQ